MHRDLLKIVKFVRQDEATFSFSISRMDLKCIGSAFYLLRMENETVIHIQGKSLSLDLISPQSRILNSSDS